MSAPVSELSRTCAPVMNGPAAACGADLDPIPPFATPANAAPNAIIATTMAGEGRRSSRRNSDFLDTRIPPFGLPDGLVENVFKRLPDTNAHFRDRSTAGTQQAAPEADVQPLPLRLHVAVDGLGGRHAA